MVMYQARYRKDCREGERERQVSQGSDYDKYTYSTWTTADINVQFVATFAWLFNAGAS